MSDKERFPNMWPQVLHAARRAGYPIKDLKAATGVPESTLYKVMDGSNMPRWPIALKLIEALPNSLVSRLVAPVGLTVSALEGDRCDHSTLAAMCRTAASFAEALEDNRIDHQEYGAMRHQVESVRDMCDAWLAQPNPQAATVTVLGRVK